MNKLGIFMNFWEKNWAADHKKYIAKAAQLGFDVLEFQAQPLLEMSDEKLLDIKKCADEFGIELTYIKKLSSIKTIKVSTLSEERLKRIDRFR